MTTMNASTPPVLLPAVRPRVPGDPADEDAGEG